MQTIKTSLTEFQPTRRTGPFWQIFLKKGYQIDEARIQDKPILRMTNPNGNRWVTSTNISYPMISPLAQEIAEHKFNMYALAEKSGLCIPATELLGVGQSVQESVLLNAHPKLIVKPLDSYGSKGLTLNISSQEQLDEAVKLAREVSKDVLIQEQVDGDELRFTILNGKVISVLRRQSPQVVGDGESTVAHLIELENDKRKSYSFEHIEYPQLSADIIDAAWLEDQTIPVAGEVVTFSRATMVRDGASIFDVIDEIDDSYKIAAEALAVAIGTGFITVDIFIQDASVPIEQGRYWFNECNTAPALRLYYADINNKGPRVAEAITDAMDKMIRG